MPGWTGSTRRDRLPHDWPKIRRKVLRRDADSCQVPVDDEGTRCLDHARQVDHIRRGDDHDLLNLQAICDWHHQKKSSSEGGNALAEKRRAKREKFKRHKPHPSTLVTETGWA